VSLPVLLPSSALTGASLSPEVGAPSFLKRYVLRFRNGAFLHAYKDDGIYFVFDLQRACLFATPPSFVADIFHAEILIVLTDTSGRNVRRTLLDRPVTSGVYL